jgi:hypothetical protein
MKVLDFGVPIPFDLINDPETMHDITSLAVYNQDIPGAIESVHPNKFIAHLRPVEEFRHTPVIPISEKDLADYKKKVEEANRKGWYLEIRKDKIYFWIMTVISFTIIIYIMQIVNQNVIHDKFKQD